jgi:hypothetical protein
MAETRTKPVQDGQHSIQSGAKAQKGLRQIKVNFSAASDAVDTAELVSKQRARELALEMLRLHRPALEKLAQ